MEFAKKEIGSLLVTSDAFTILLIVSDEAGSFETFHAI